MAHPRMIRLSWPSGLLLTLLVFLSGSSVHAERLLQSQQGSTPVAAADPLLQDPILPANDQTDQTRDRESRPQAAATAVTQPVALTSAETAQTVGRTQADGAEPAGGSSPGTDAGSQEADGTAVAAVGLTGDRIQLNGRSLSAAWSQRGEQIGVADGELVQALGLELLNTPNPSAQPVRWFSPSGAPPQMLSSWFAGQSRQLDITALAARAGWRVTPTQSTLNITAPPAQITNLRRGRQTWGDRIVIDLDRPALWQVSEQSGALTLTLDAPTPTALIAPFNASLREKPGNLLQSVKASTTPQKTTLTLKFKSTAQPRIWTVGEPDRLVIDLRPDAMQERNIHWAPGVRWQQTYLMLGNARFPVQLLAVDLKAANIDLQPIWTNPTAAPGIAQLKPMAQRWQAAAAINGGFFNRNNQLPLGAIRQNGQWISGPILNRGAIAWNDSGQVYMGRLSLEETAIAGAGQAFPITALNSGYVKAGVARYTPTWGATYTPLIDNEVIATVRGNQVVQQQKMGTAGSGSVPIPRDGYILAIRAYTAAANAMAVGATVQIDSGTIPEQFAAYPHTLGAGPLLLQNRQIVLDAAAEQFSPAFIQQAAARSAIGQTANGQIILVAVQNRVGGRGPTLTEMAQIMQLLGATDALNLDGGNSTTLYLGGQVLNRPSRTAARVHNGLGVQVQSDAR